MIVPLKSNMGGNSYIYVQCFTFVFYIFICVLYSLDFVFYIFICVLYSLHLYSIFSFVCCIVYICIL